MEGSKPGILHTQPKHLKTTFFAEVDQLKNWSFVPEVDIVSDFDDI